MVEYEKILADLENEKNACQYAYNGMVPAFYTYALCKAIEAITECQSCAAAAQQAAKEQTMRGGHKS